MLGNGETIDCYRIVRRIGTGAMGEVYEVEHVALGVRYALKTFALEGGGDAAFLRERFMAEGRALARIAHPNIARVFDLGTLPDGTAYFVMDLVLDADGEPRTLADVAPDGFGDADRLRWLMSIASALDAIHEEGIVHRDVKLSNILLDAKNDAVLADFGIARYVRGRIKREIGVERTLVAGEGDEARKLVMGTGGYLAPELKNGGEATAASDTYALGVAFFRLLTGLWYEPGTDAMRLLEPLGGPWRRILPPMLADDPAERPASLSGFLASRLIRGKIREALRSRGTAFARLAAAVASMCVLAAAAVAWLAPSGRCAAGGRTLDFDLGGGERIEMVECRGADGKRFWMGATHVTNAQWERVTGKKRGGADAKDVPATGMGMHEIRSFVAELNRRFSQRLPHGVRFRLPSTNELAVASTAGGANAADGSALGVTGPSLADKKAAWAAAGRKWNPGLAKQPCRVRVGKPNAWGIYDIVGQGRTICRETEVSRDGGNVRRFQLGPDSIADVSTVGEWGWNSTVRLAAGGD